MMKNNDKTSSIIFKIVLSIPIILLLILSALSTVPGILPADDSRYSSVKETFDEEGRLTRQLFFDANGIQTTNSLGVYGFSYEYDDQGRLSSVTSIDSTGNPMPSFNGYATVKMTYDADGNLETEMYYGTNGEQVSVLKGVYGYKYKSGRKTPVDRDGNEIYKLRYFLLDSFGVDLLIGLLLILFIVLAGRKQSVVLLLLYLLFLIYMTLIDRPSINMQSIQLYINESFYNFLTDKEVLENIWLFVPLGCLMYKVFVPRGKSAVSAILYCVGLSLVIECTQAILHIGWCTLSDLISNSLGGMIGVIIGYLASPTSKVPDNVNRCS